MTNANAIKLLSPRTVSLLREHAKALSVDEIKLASDLFEMMVQDGVFDVVLDTAKGAATTNVTTSQVIRLWEFKPECVD